MTQVMNEIVGDYVANYLMLTAQAADEASVDNQLSNLTFSLLERISRSATGAIVDVGCGNGVLLSRLLEIPEFVGAKGWVYIAVDTNDYLDAINDIVRSKRMGRKVELVELNSFYDEWPAIASPQIIFCRNVLHELNVAETSRLLSYVSNKMSHGDELIIQDLFKLPTAERRSACWIPQLLKEVISEHAFEDVMLLEQFSRSGNGWFNLSAKRSSQNPVSEVTSKRVVKASRQQQWTLWSQVEKIRSNDDEKTRSPLIEALDIDFQLAALTRQLRDEGAIGLTLDDSVERKVRSEEFGARISSFLKAEQKPKKLPKDPIHFRERGTQLTILEEFLRSSGTTCLVQGGQGTGKTTLVRHLLETRAYEKFSVIIDGNRTTSYWAFVESLLSQLGVRLAPELLSVISSLTPSSVAPAISQLINSIAPRSIVFYDNFSSIQGPDGVIADAELSRLLEKWVTKQGAKVIMASRNNFIPPALRFKSSDQMPTVKVGRYGDNQTVINILDDHFDRGAAGLAKYPEALINAIDRHPLIVSLAAQNLRKHGANLLMNEDFVSELRHQMRSELWARLIDSENEPAVEIASNLRVPVPKELLAKFCSSAAISAAVEDDVIYSLADNRWREIFGVLGVFRLRELRLHKDDSESDASYKSVDHHAIAQAYRVIYRQDDDPKWIRESYFHALLAGGGDASAISSELGKYYYDELVASANYTFQRKRNYEEALHLFEIAKEMSPLNQSAEMRRASCLIRQGHRAEGAEAYAKLVDRYPELQGIKTSHVDALLFTGDFEAASVQLTAYDLPRSDEWVAYEWGRVYLGLDQYKSAVEMFRPLVAQHKEDAHFHTFFARALEQYGAFSDAQFVLTNANSYFGGIAQATGLGVLFEHREKYEEALKLLEPAFQEREDNAQAAASLVRIYCRTGRTAEARDVVRRASKGVPDKYREYMTACYAEIRLAEGKADLAIQEMKSRPLNSAYSWFALMRCYLDASLLSQGEKRVSLLTEALNEAMPARFKSNAPIQILKAKLALEANDEGAFEDALGNLEASGLDKSVIQALGGARSF